MVGHEAEGTYHLAHGGSSLLTTHSLAAAQVSLQICSCSVTSRTEHWCLPRSITATYFTGLLLWTTPLLFPLVLPILGKKKKQNRKTQPLEGTTEPEILSSGVPI